MKQQNNSNHIRISLPWHIITGGAIVLLGVGAVMNFVHASREDHFSSVTLLILPVVLLLLWAFSRQMILKVQDRAIRAEESLRHYILTGKPIDKQLRLRQIIALRFASDEELPALAKRAVAEKLEPGQIKKAVINWKADHHRA
jgi:hypothetical protein